MRGRGRNLIGTKHPKEITEDVFKKVQVIDRKREICKVKCDIDNGLYEPDEQILPPTFKGTHDGIKSKKSILKTITQWLEQLLP